MSKRQYFIKCPLCGVNAPHKPVLTEESHYKQQIDVWICPECPFVGFEFIRHRMADFKRLYKLLQ